MKKSITLLSLLLYLTLLNAQTNYYVSPTGNDEADGSVDFPFLTVKKATDAAVAYTASNDFVINVAAGTYTEGVIFAQVDRVATITIKGTGANETILQHCSDEEFGTIAHPGRLFALTNAKNYGLTLIIEDVTIRNLGFENTNGGVVANITKDGIHFAMKRCNVYNTKARTGAIIQMWSDGGSLTLEQCKFYNSRSFYNQAISSPLLIKKGSVFIKNCEFSNIVKYASSTTPATVNSGSVIDLYNNSGNIYAEIINNTFYNNKLEEEAAGTISEIQAAVRIQDDANSENTINLFVYNNLFLDNRRSESTDVDFNLVTNDAITLLGGTNNILNAQVGLDDLSNLIDPTLTYTSSEIDFPMNGDAPYQYVSSTGVRYSQPHGSYINGFATAVEGKTPTVDIAGNTRPEAFSIGAFEAGFFTSVSKENKISATKIFANDEGIVLNNNVASVKIYSSTGQLVKQANNCQSVIPMHHKGLYIVVANLNNGERISTKVMIK